MLNHTTIRCFNNMMVWFKQYMRYTAAAAAAVLLLHHQ